MKSKFFLCCIPVFILSSCKEKVLNETHSSLYRLVDSLPIDKSKNILIYTINPNDCISCMNGFRSMSDGVSNGENGELFIISVAREIEKQELSKKINGIDLKEHNNKSVVWNQEAFNAINKALNVTLPISLVAVYNFEKDTVLYYKQIREVADDHEIKKALEIRL